MEQDLEGSFAEQTKSRGKIIESDVVKKTTIFNPFNREI